MTHRFAKPGSILLMTLVILLLMSSQLLILGLIVNRSLGQESTLLTRNTTAREGLSVGFNQLHDDMLTYIRTNGIDGPTLLTEFGVSGASRINDVAIQVRNPETGALENSPARVTTWIDSYRGDFYKLKSQVTYGEVDLTSSRWIQLTQEGASSASSSSSSSCSNTGLLSVKTDAIQNPTTPQSLFMDTANDRLIINTAIYDTDSLSFVTTIPEFETLTHDTTNNVIFFYDSLGNFHKLFQDNTITTIPSMKSDGPSSIGVYSGTGDAFAYRTNGSITDGIYRYQPDGTTSLVMTIRGAIASSTQGTYIYVNPLSGRVYATKHTSSYDSTGSNQIATWAAGTGATTIYVNNTSAGSDNLGLDVINERLYFGDRYANAVSNTYFYSWTPTEGMTTIHDSTRDCGYLSTSVDPVRETVFFRDCKSGSREFLYQWSPTIGDRYIYEVSATPVKFDSIDNATGHFYYVTYDDVHVFNPINDSNTHILNTKDMDTALTSSIHPYTHPHQFYQPDFYPHRTDVPPLADVYPGVYFVNTDDGIVNRWNPSTGLTTLLTGYTAANGILGQSAVVIDPKTGSFYAKGDSASGVYYYSQEDGTITSTGSQTSTQTGSFGYSWNTANLDTPTLMYQYNNNSDGNSSVFLGDFEDCTP